MARTEGRTHTSIWTHNEDFWALSIRAQRLYWFLYSQPNINLCGVVPLTLGRWAKKAKDSTVKSLTEDLAELQAAANPPYVIVDWDTEEVWVRTFPRWDGVVRSPKTLKSALEQLPGISSPRIRELAAEQLRRRPDTPSDGVLDGVSDAPSDGVGDRSRTRTGADSVSSLRLQSPSPDSDSVSAAAPPDESGDEHRNGQPPPWSADPLVQRWCAEVTGSNRGTHRAEIWRVIEHLRAHVDESAIDEAIGRCIELDSPVSKPNFLLKMVTNWAAERDIRVPPLPKPVSA